MPSRGDVRPSGLEEASSLWRRLVLGFGAVVVVVVGIGIGAGGLLVQSAVDAEERELAGTLARVVSDSVHRISFSGKYHAQLLIDEYVEQQRDLVYVRIELLDGGLYAQAGRTPDGVQSLAAPPAIGDQLVRDLRVDGGRVREVVTPFLGGHDEEQVGYVRIGISREGAAARLRQAVVTLLAFGLLLTLSAMLAVHLTSRRFARPVQALAAEFAGILERTPLALCIQDRDGRIVRASTRFGRDFAAGAEVRGHQLAEFVDPGDRAALAEEDHRLLDGADNLGERELTVRVNGESRRYLMSRFGLVGASGGDVQLLCTVAVDVTALRALEETLVQSRRMESIGQFAGGVAHDFNNILTGIAGVTDLIAMIDGAPQELRDRCDELRSLNRMAAELTARLLSFGRKQVTVVAPHDLNAVLRDLRSFLTRILREDVRIQMDLEPSAVLPAEVDRGQIDQVVMNLVSNARDAMPGGGVISIRTGHEALNADRIVGKDILPAGQYAVIRVADEGTGIPAEIADHLFDPFATTKGLGKGTGLGLSIVYSIVTRHRGAIEFSSRADVGTEFRIWIPLCPVDRLRTATPAAAIHRELSRPLRILVVEDNSFVRSSVVGALRRLGHEVWEAADGVAGLDVFMEQPDRYDVALIDVVMPKLNGAEVCAEISAVRPRLPILFMTGYDDGILSDVGHDPDRLGWVQKPFTIARLLERVEELLAGAS